MEKLALFIIFAIFSAVRTFAENQAKKPQQKSTIPAAPKRPGRPFDQPLRRLEEVLKEAEKAFSTREEQPQREQPKLKTPAAVEHSGEGVSLEHPPTPPPKIGHLDVAPPMQSSAVEKLPPASLHQGFMGDKEEVLRGLVYAEILGPPKAFQHFRRR